MQEPKRFAKLVLTLEADTLDDVFALLAHAATTIINPSSPAKFHYPTPYGEYSYLFSVIPGMTHERYYEQVTEYERWKNEQEALKRDVLALAQRWASEVKRSEYPVKDIHLSDWINQWVTDTDPGGPSFSLGITLASAKTWLEDELT